MPDFDAIGVAIAARYAPAAITANGGPPAGLTNVRRSTSDLPNQVEPGTVLIIPDDVTLTPGNGGRIVVTRWFARFYLVVAKDLPRETNQLRKWLTVLVDQHRTSMQLGGTVAAVRTRGARIGQLRYAGRTYSGLELRLEVVSSEPWLPTA